MNWVAIVIGFGVVYAVHKWVELTYGEGLGRLAGVVMMGLLWFGYELVKMQKRVDAVNERLDRISNKVFPPFSDSDG